MRVAAEQPKSILDRVDQWPVKVEQLASRPVRENDASHSSPTGSALSEVAVKFLERHGLVPG